MRALAAIVMLAVWSCRSHAHLTPDLSRLLPALGVLEHDPVHRLVTCSETIGPSKCLSALSLWRAEKAIKKFEGEQQPQFNVTADVERFPWKKYSNSSDEELYSELCDGAEKLLRHRPLSLAVSGYKLDLESRGDGRLKVNVFKSTDDTGRSSMKKMTKKFYNILPFLMVPGLIMSAILPFVLPALKLMVVAVGMLNNMALSGAVFTLLRNNAFSQDNYEKRIIYLNEGYKNEKMTPVHFEHVDVPDDVGSEYASSNLHSVTSNINGMHVETIEELPPNPEWIKQFYGIDGMKVRRNSKDKGSRIIKQSM